MKRQRKDNGDRMVKLTEADVVRLTYVAARIGMTPTEVVSTLIRDTYALISKEEGKLS